MISSVPIVTAPAFSFEPIISDSGCPCNELIQLRIECMRLRKRIRELSIRLGEPKLGPAKHVWGQNLN